jgi:hypothetical protein
MVMGRGGTLEVASEIAAACRDPEYLSYLAYLWIPFLLSSGLALRSVFFDPQISQMFMAIARYRYRREMRG